MIYVITYKVLSNTGDEIKSGQIKVKHALSYEDAVDKLSKRMKHNFIDFGKLKIIEYKIEYENDHDAVEFLKSIFKFSCLLLFLSSCATDKKIGNAGIAECADFKRMATYCLRDFLTGEDAGGVWQQIGTTPQDLSSLLIGDNPCFEWSDKACGQYEFRYIVGDACCRDTAIVRPLKCCLTGLSNCN